jgi:hypothetical protein
MNQSSATLPVVVIDEEQDRAFGRVRREEVPIDALRTNLDAFLNGMEGALPAIPATMSGYQINEITLSLEVGASGKVSLMGTGAELSGKGGLTLTLTRR